MPEKYPPLSRLTGLRPGEVDVLLRALKALEGEVDDLDTLETIETLRSRIRENLEDRGSVFGM